MFIHFAKSIFLFIIFIFFGCNSSLDNNRFLNEIYLNEKFDTSLLKQAINYRDTLLKRFNIKAIDKNSINTTYHLMFYSSMRFGQSIKLEKRDTFYYIESICKIEDSINNKCNNISMKISYKEWQTFENMIYEYNFWTENQFEKNENVLDGFVFIIEGVRPEAKLYNKRTYQFIGRSSTLYDKITDLCDNIISYKESLAFKYIISKNQNPN